MKDIEVISVREKPEFAQTAIAYIQNKWPEVPGSVYRNSIGESLYSTGPLPQWYLLSEGGRPIGCGGLITNDFISRMDLYPWLCALYIEEEKRGKGLPALLIDRCAEDTLAAGFTSLYLSTDHIGYYERYGFYYLGEGFHPWDEQSHIYKLNLRTRRMLGSGEYTIRPETPADYDEIYDLIRIAFETAKVKDGDEQDYSNSLRDNGGYLPELSLVVEKSRYMAGHIMLTRTYIRRDDGTRRETLLLSPVSVLPEHRGQGVGAILIEEALRRARDAGHTSVFLCGDPQYYHRFGFRSLADTGIRPSIHIDLSFAMVAELIPGALEGIEGVVDIC